MRLYLRLAWRNLWRHRRRTLIVVLAMALSLSLMMMYDGLIAGFNQAIYGNAVKVLGGNIQVHAAGFRAKADQLPLLPLENDQAVIDAALKQSQVVAASRRIKTGGLASSHEGAFPVTITAIEPEAETQVNLAAQHVVEGRFLQASDQDQVLIGKGLAEAMGVKLGDRFALSGRAMHEQMRQRSMTIVGIYDLGMPDIEKRSVFISLGEAQMLYNLTGQSTEVAISLKNIGEEPAVIAAMKPGLPGYEIEPFQENFPELASALDAKGGVMNVFSVIIVVIAGLGIINLLLMAIYERTREIGLLGSIGFRPNQIALLFILEGTMMGLVGVATGVAFGLLTNGLLMKYGLDFSTYSSVTSYMALITGKVYPSWGMEKLFSRALVIAIVSSLASFYPAFEASRREPAEALHYV